MCALSGVISNVNTGTPLTLQYIDLEDIAVAMLMSTLDKTLQPVVAKADEYTSLEHQQNLHIHDTAATDRNN